MRSIDRKAKRGEGICIALGVCQCGCGQRTSLATSSDVSSSRVKGEPMRFVQGHQNRRRPEARYTVEDRGYLSPCWIFDTLATSTGYGVFTYERKRQYAHRYFYEQVNGPVPSGLQIDHLCRVRACVNPKHLEPVSHAENGRRGAATKLSRADVLRIRELAAAGGRNNLQLAEQFGVGSPHISRIVNNKTWAGLPTCPHCSGTKHILDTMETTFGEYEDISYLCWMCRGTGRAMTKRERLTLKGGE